MLMLRVSGGAAALVLGGGAASADSEAASADSELFSALPLAPRAADASAASAFSPAWNNRNPSGPPRIWP
jgi:hypothetical protein